MATWPEMVASGTCEVVESSVSVCVCGWLGVHLGVRQGVAYVGHACSSGKGGAEGEGRGCPLSSSCPVTPPH